MLTPPPPQGLSGMGDNLQLTSHDLHNHKVIISTSLDHTLDPSLTHSLDAHSLSTSLSDHHSLSTSLSDHHSLSTSLSDGHSLPHPGISQQEEGIIEETVGGEDVLNTQEGEWTHTSDTHLSILYSLLYIKITHTTLFDTHTHTRT